MNAIRPLDGRIFAYEPIVKAVTGRQLALPNHYQISTKRIAGCLLVMTLTFRYTTFQRAISRIGASDNSLARIWISASGCERERSLASNVMDCTSQGFSTTYAIDVHWLHPKASALRMPSLYIGYVPRLQHYVSLQLYLGYMIVTIPRLQNYVCHPVHWLHPKASAVRISSSSNERKESWARTVLTLAWQSKTWHDFYSQIFPSNCKGWTAIFCLAKDEWYWPSVLNNNTQALTLGVNYDDSGQHITDLDYADDIVIVADLLDTLKDALYIFNEQSQKLGYMSTGPRPSFSPSTHGYPHPHQHSSEHNLSQRPTTSHTLQVVEIRK